jgi:hypothetical protein
MDAIPGLKVLDEAGIKKLYFTALEVLERTGVSVPQKTRWPMFQGGL